MNATGRALEGHRRRLRVAYVLLGDPGARSPDELLALLPTVARTARALEATGRVDVHVVARIGSAYGGARLDRDGAAFHFVDTDDRAGGAMASLVAAVAPDVVHVNGLVFPHATETLAAEAPDAVVLVQHHGELPPGGVRTHLALRRAARTVDAFAFTGASAGQAEPWRRLLGRHAAVVEVLESSTDLRSVDRDAARRTLGIVGEPAVLWVGRFTQGKDPVTAIAAFAALLARRPDARLWMLARDRNGEEAVSAAVDARPELAERVHVAGPVPHREMASWFSAADVLVSTSRHEGSGYSVVEAMACGCPVVVSDIAPHRVIVAGAGPLVPVGDVAGFADVLATARLGEDTRRIMRRTFEARLGWPAVAEQLLAAYAAAGAS